MTAAAVQRRPGAGLSVALLVAVFACGGDPTGLAEVFPDGHYVIRIAVPLVDEGAITPGWMREEPWILVTKSGTSLVVTMSASELVARGPAALFEPSGSRWAVRLRLRVAPEHRYWALDLTSSVCVAAQAIDADPTLPAGAIKAVRYAGCAIEPQ